LLAKRGVFILAAAILAACFTYITICMADEDRSMKKLSIAPELEEKYTDLAKKFIQDSRGWAEQEYNLEFGFVREDIHVALFVATHIDDMIDTKIRMREENFTVRRETESVGIMIDTETLKAYEDHPDVYSPWNPRFAKEPEKTMTAPSR